MNYWLMKSEPSEYGIEDLEREPAGRGYWDGVRNYQARNFIRAMMPGDRAFFYHSSCPKPGISGIMRIVSRAWPDPGQFDPDDPHYDPKSSVENPRWSLVEVAFEKRFTPLLCLQRLRETNELDDMLILRRGNRLSVTPVTIQQWHCIERMMHANNNKK
ncbi:MAG: EVE domain-containing protein [Gammaproteobacteria bacterium]|nr:EVE domain-containing protein [Gammaproteobacteria bacterium]